MSACALPRLQVCSLTPRQFATSINVLELSVPDPDALRRRFLSDLHSTAASVAAAGAADRPAAPGAAPPRPLTSTAQHSSAGSMSEASMHLSSPLFTGAACDLAWHRPCPAVMTPFPEELMWLPIAPTQHLLWDSNMGEDTSSSSLVRAGSAAACTEAQHSIPVAVTDAVYYIGVRVASCLLLTKALDSSRICLDFHYQSMHTLNIRKLKQYRLPLVVTYPFLKSKCPAL